jgi:hypothetical protein
LVKRNGKTILGIEVTDYFQSESDARLKNIPDYAGNLLAQRKYRHKDDKLRLPVKRVTYVPQGDKSRGREIDAIMIEHPSLAERIEKLVRIVNTKEARYPTYVGKAPVVRRERPAGRVKSQRAEQGIEPIRIP